MCGRFLNCVHVWMDEDEEEQVSWAMKAEQIEEDQCKGNIYSNY